MISRCIENLKFTFMRFSVTCVNLGPASLAFSYQGGCLLFRLHMQAPCHCSCCFEPKKKKKDRLPYHFRFILLDLNLSITDLRPTPLGEHSILLHVTVIHIDIVWRALWWLVACQLKLILFNAFYYSCREESPKDLFYFWYWQIKMLKANSSLKT